MASARPRAEEVGAGAKSRRSGEERLANLEILQTVGTGTFGRVVLTRRKDNGEYFALKVLNISEVIRLKQTEHVKQEKDILLRVSHPFIVNMLWSHHNSRFLYMLLEFVPGGELFTYLRTAGHFNVPTVLFYAAEIVCAIEHLHKQQIVYRDLKPENLLLTGEGHLKITDFGFAKEVEDRTFTLCGTPEYLAPEIIKCQGHNKAVDWWALGILMYEMLIGYPPFFDENPFAIYQKILSGKVDWPKHMDANAKDLLKKLLAVDRTRRLGSMRSGAEDIKRHKFFKGVNWDDVPKKKLTPPIVPVVSHPGDASCFNEYSEDDWQTAPTVAGDLFKPFEDF